MLDNARKYQEELKIKMMDTWYDEKYKYYHYGGWHSEINLSTHDWENIYFVSLNKDNEIIGYIAYSVDRNISGAYDFGAINFSNDKLTFGRDLVQVIDDIFCSFGLERIEFKVVCGNPIERSYDRMVERFGGRIVGVRKRVAKLMDNQIYDEKMYEILREDYLAHKMAGCESGLIERS